MTISPYAVKIAAAYAADAKMEQLLGYDDDYNDVEVPGIAFNLAGSDPDAHMRVIRDLDSSLAPIGYAAFLTERNRLSDEERETLHEYQAAVIKCDDPFAALRVRKTAAFNYDLSTSDIIEKLQSWNTQLGLQVVGADYDWVALIFKSLPRDIKAFAADIFDFCPYVVSQGTGAYYESLSDDDLREAGYALEAGMDTEEGGLALLAQQLARTKALHLWWD